MPERVRVLVVDDHPVVRQGLRTFLGLQPDIEVVAEAADGHEALTHARAARPDVVLMDLVMPGTGGVAAIRSLRAALPQVKVIVLTSFAGEDQVLPAVRAGAAGYLLKDARPAEILDAIRRAGQGQALLDPAVAATVLHEVAHPPARPGRLGTLTRREQEVLRLLARGLSNREAARRLGVSEKTVKTHVSHLLAKLRVADRTQAALVAVRDGLVEPDDIGPAT